jgi:hypothetical protein
MPAVDLINRSVVGREYATYSTRFTWQGSTFDSQFGVSHNAIINTDQAADFWVDQIGAIIWMALKLNTDPSFRQFSIFGPVMAVQVSDIRTGRSLSTSRVLPTNPDGSPLVLPWPQDAIPIAVMHKTAALESTPNVVDNIPQPSQFRDTGTLPQPFCVTRSGGLAVTVTNFQNLSVNTGQILRILDVTLMFSGWKEYANASR